jgi:membrane-bound serine protease (ClpP class)
MVMVMAFFLQQASWAQAPSASTPTVVLLDIKGAIGPATTEYLSKGLTAAADRKAAAVVIRVDTPGGLVSSTRDIIRAMLASPVPVLAYVAPGGAQAASAGTYIVYASHLAAMAPGTNIGAATVVTMGERRGPGDEQPALPVEGKPDKTPDKAADKTQDKAPDKVEPDMAPGKGGPTDASTRKAINDAAAFIRSLADMHGRNAQWAEDAVRNGVSIPANEALEKKVVDILAGDLNGLLAQADGRQVNLHGKRVALATKDAQVAQIEPDWRTRFLGVITNPEIAYVLMLLGVYGIIFELMSPGAVFPGILGAVALVTALFAFNLLPVNYAGVGLVLLGIGLMVAEAFTPTLGLVGIAGVAIFAFGSLFVFDSGEPQFALSLPVVITATIVMGLMFAILMRVALRAHRRKAISGDSMLIGHVGQVLFWSGTGGRIRLGDETWDAHSSTSFAPGARVVITARDGLTLTVEAAGTSQEDGS